MYKLYICIYIHIYYLGLKDFMLEFRRKLFICKQIVSFLKPNAQPFVNDLSDDDSSPKPNVRFEARKV